MNATLDLLAKEAPNGTAIAISGATPAPAPTRLAHLFRASLSQGRLHPLYMPMLQYRSAGATVPA